MTSGDRGKADATRDGLENRKNFLMDTCQMIRRVSGRSWALAWKPVASQKVKLALQTSSLVILQVRTRGVPG